MILNFKFAFFPKVALVATAIFWGQNTLADSKAFVPQAQDRVGSAYVLQAHQVRNVRVAAAKARRLQQLRAQQRRAQQAQAQQARAQQQQIERAISAQDAEILEFPANGLPALPNAHVAVR